MRGGSGCAGCHKACVIFYHNTVCGAGQGVRAGTGHSRRWREEVGAAVGEGGAQRCEGPGHRAVLAPC